MSFARAAAATGTTSKGQPGKSAADVNDHVAGSASAVAVSDTTCDSASGTEAAAADETAAHPAAIVNSNRFGSCVTQ